MRRTLVALFVAAFAAAGLVSATAAQADTAPKARGATTITFNVTGCEGCTIQAMQYSKQQTKTYQSDPTKVKNGVATIGVPTARTKGMYFSIVTPKVPRINALPLITVQYKGAAPGTTVTKAKAKASKSASACWAGTTAGTATLSVTVKRVVMESFPDASKKTSVPLAYFQPSVKAYGGFNEPFKGVVATQDVWVCGPGSSNDRDE